MISSLARIITIGRNTLTEAVRQKVLNILLIFSIVLVGSSVSVSQLATPGLDSAGIFDAQIKFVKDFGCGAIGLFGFFIALLSTAQLIPQELHNRTIYTILAKPVRRAEFLLGKFFGVVLLLALCVALMSLAFAATLYWQELRGIAAADKIYNVGTPSFLSSPGAVEAYNHEVAGIVSQVRDPQIVEGDRAALHQAGDDCRDRAARFHVRHVVHFHDHHHVHDLPDRAHGEHCAGSLARAGADASIFQSGLVGLISLLIPDMNSFTIVDEILAGNKVPWSHTLNLLGYADVYLIVLLGISVVIFDYREI